MSKKNKKQVKDFSNLDENSKNDIIIYAKKWYDKIFERELNSDDMPLYAWEWDLYNAIRYYNETEALSSINTPVTAETASEGTTATLTKESNE